MQINTSSLKANTDRKSVLNVLIRFISDSLDESGIFIQNLKLLLSGSEAQLIAVMIMIMINVEEDYNSLNK
jgi:hypothetical protein